MKVLKHESIKTLVFGIVQGSVYKDLREQSARDSVALDFDGYAIGGVAVGEPQKEKYQVVDWVAPMLPEDKPRYLMGLGQPEELVEAVRRGIDMFDCVLPTRGGRHGSAWINGDKKISLKSSKFVGDGGPINKKCDCATCKAGYSRAFLRHLFKSQDPLAGSLASVHNLRYLYRLCEEYQK